MFAGIALFTAPVWAAIISIGGGGAAAAEGTSTINGIMGGSDFIGEVLTGMAFWPHLRNSTR
jgi:hypothetical protein